MNLITAPLKLNFFSTIKNIKKTEQPLNTYKQNSQFELSADKFQKSSISFTGNFQQRLNAGESIPIKELMAGYEDNKELFDSPLTEFDTAEVISARKALAQKPKQLKPTVDINTPERKELRAEILDKMYGSGAERKEHKLVIVFGSPGSGKSTCAINPIVKEYGALKIDGDEVRSFIPEYQENHDFDEVHLECREIKKALLEKAMNNGDNIVYHTGGRTLDSLQKTCKKAKEQGYNVKLVLVDINPEEAAKRVIKRFNETQRFNDPYEILNDVGRRPYENYQNMKKTNLCDNFTLYDNNGTIEEGAKIIEEI